MSYATQAQAVGALADTEVAALQAQAVTYRSAIAVLKAQILALQTQPVIPPLTEPALPTALPSGCTKELFRTSFDTPVALGGFVPDGNSNLPASNPYGNVLRMYPGWPDTRGKMTGMGWGGIYSAPKCVSVHDGLLDVNLHSEGGQFYGAAISPKLAAPFLYGQIDVCFSMENCSTGKIAPLLWPDTDVWADGEIDFPESDPLGGPATGFMHFVGDPGNKDSRPMSGVDLSKLNVFSVVWRAGVVKFLVNGVQVGADCTHAVPAKPMHYVFQCESTLVSATKLDTTKSGRVKVAWMRVCQ